MFFISKKKLNKYIVDEVEKKILLHTYAKQDIKGVIENCISSIDTKKTDDKLKEIFDAWIKEALDDVTITKYHYAFDHTSFYKELGKVEKSLSSIMYKICGDMFNQLREICGFSDKEEFIDKVVERIQKKQITK